MNLLSYSHTKTNSHTVIQCPVWSFKIYAVLQPSHSPPAWFASVAGSLEGLKTDAATAQVSLGNDHAFGQTASCMGQLGHGACGSAALRMAMRYTSP